MPVAVSIRNAVKRYGKTTALQSLQLAPGGAIAAPAGKTAGKGAAKKSSRKR